jgi:acyl carrier protein
MTNSETNSEKLRQLVQDVFLLDPAEFRLDLTRDDVDTWDSLGVVSLAVGVHETFGYHMTAEEAGSIHGLSDLIELLGSKGVSFDGSA